MQEDPEGYSVVMGRFGDALCIHGGAAEVVRDALDSDAPPDTEPPIVLALAAHPLRTGRPAAGGGHEAGPEDLTETVVMLGIDDAAMLVAWLMSAISRGGLMPAFKSAMHEAAAEVRHTVAGREDRPMFTLAPRVPEGVRMSTPDIGGYL